MGSLSSSWLGRAVLALGIVCCSGLVSPSSASSYALGNACKNPPHNDITPGGPSKEYSITSNNTKRSFRIYFPEKYHAQTPAPLILSFHGRGKTAKSQEELSQFSNPLFNKDMIAVYPQGIHNQWYGDPRAPLAINDTLFVNDLLNRLSQRYCIDPSRVYAAGKSNGGGLVNILACSPSLSQRIAAFAIVSGALYTSSAVPPIGPCEPGRTPIPILEFHGGADKIIPYCGRKNVGTDNVDVEMFSHSDDSQQPELDDNFKEQPDKGSAEASNVPPLCIPDSETHQEETISAAKAKYITYPIPTWLRQWVARDGLVPTNTSVSLYGGKVTEYKWMPFIRKSLPPSISRAQAQDGSENANIDNVFEEEHGLFRRNAASKPPIKNPETPDDVSLKEHSPIRRNVASKPPIKKPVIPNGVITHYFVSDMGHDWPATVPNSDNNGQVTYFNATPIIVDFFRQYRLL